MWWRVQTRYLVDVLPAHVPSTTPAMDEPNPRLGVGERAHMHHALPPWGAPSPSPALPRGSRMVPSPSLPKCAAHARWSPDSQFLATQNENMPGAVWVWDMATMELCAVLNHLADVLDVQWAPHVSSRC